MTSVIIATKDLIKCGRGIDRLYYQVLSLRQQSEEVEIIIVDGSGFPEHKRITQRLHGMGVRMIHAEQSVMNLPKLWNLGVREAQGEWIHISGSDFLYAPTFMDRIKEVRNDLTLVMCKVWELPRMNITNNNVLKWQWPTLKEFFAANPKLANGIQHGTKKLFLEIPYDERMEKLGGMDNLQQYKCERNGYECFWWEQQLVLHQWHKISPMKMDKQFNENQKVISSYIKETPINGVP